MRCAVCGNGERRAARRPHVKSRATLSMDNEISYGIGMFVEMQTLLLQQRSRSFEATFAAGPDVPNHLRLAEVLEFATLCGAQNCDLEDKVGSLTPGKEADIALVRATDINTFPLTNTLATLVTFAGRGNVDTVFVAGTLRAWRGRLVGHDLAKIQGIVESSRATCWLRRAWHRIHPPSMDRNR